MKSRIELAPKRLKQYNQYNTILEERISLLEDRCAAYDRKMMKTNGFFPSPVSRPLSQLDPALSFKFWKEFGSGSLPENIIDVLIGEPEVTRMEKMQRSANKLLQGRNDPMDPIEEIPPIEMQYNEGRNRDEEVAKIKGKQMPERIRFNVSSIPRLFFKACLGEASDNIMLRPFKPLVRKAEEIQDIMSEIQEALEVMIGERANQDQDEVKRNSQSNGAGSHDKETRERSKQPQALEERDVIHKDDWEEEWPTKSAVDRSFKSIQDLLENYLLPVHSNYRSQQADMVHFHDLWHLFQTGDVIIRNVNTKAEDQTSASVKSMRLLLTRGGRRFIQPVFPPPIFNSNASAVLDREADSLAPINGINPFQIDAYYLDFNGFSWQPVLEKFVIMPFTGQRRITDFSVYPLGHAKHFKFYKLNTANTIPYVECNGPNLSTREEVNDKVVVDMKSYFNTGLADRPKFFPPRILDVSETSDCPFGRDCGYVNENERRCPHRKTKIIVDQVSDIETFQRYIESREEFNVIPWASERQVPDFIICHHRVFAYKLRAREWVPVDVQSLEAPKDVDTSLGFELLVLSEDHKQILESQVREHFRKRELQGQKGGSNDGNIDLVRGKGQGLIILLHGAPGVGKTATAECIAEFMKKPLYPITCGDLGSTAQDVESNLKKHFTLASAWDCVMLLDEADVFLARRKSEDLHRNSIVSVFLRMLEYYKGLLFLTTNRVGAFDEAFKSRVHISLFYPNFDKDTTIKVWKTFIKQAKKKLDDEGRTNVTVNSSEIKKFARRHWQDNPKARWNGRQIRNAFHTAVAMAEFQAREKEKDGSYNANKDVKITIGREQFETIAKTAKEFDDYMTETMGFTYEDRASKTGMRKKEREMEKKREREDAKAKAKRLKKKDDTSDSSGDSDSDDVKEKGQSKKARGKKKMSASESEESDSDSE
ncbi:hypothetical protein ACEQ8H_008060 [Pleosporales sp. CAS-2024a]